MYLTSLDPRINRQHISINQDTVPVKNKLDQFQTYEVFHLKRENIPYAYVGPVHAPDLDIAFLYAKEQYSRRATCLGLWVVNTSDIQVTPYVNDNESVYFSMEMPEAGSNSAVQDYDIFHQKKRGKAHQFAGTVQANSAAAALLEAKYSITDINPCVNAWVIPAAKIKKSEATDIEMWLNTPDKKYREPVAYKVLDKITAFKSMTQ